MHLHLNGFGFWCTPSFLCMVNLVQVEEELKKRWSRRFNWGEKIVSIWDSQTSFVFGFDRFNDVNDEIHARLSSHARFNEIRDYALSRWYIFISNRSLASIFISHPLVRQLKGDADFYIDGLSFQLKAIDFPSNSPLKIEEAKKDKQAFLDWWMREHHESDLSKNTIYLFLQSTTAENWKLRAELGLLKQFIYEYLDGFSRKNLLNSRTKSGLLYTEVLFFEK
ncbi:MAG: hypothetical protein KJP21_05330 [Bacteroidia bacterium]|nr:hypothetical protein [Bacteroidia bacterium]NNJ56361.1 hypothetical protein [Bacteroidia bacterium]